MLLQRGQDVSSNMVCPFDTVNRGQHDDEFIPTDARNCIRTSDGVSDPLPCLLQQVVTRVMTERVVDLLEVVKVDVHHRHGGLGTASTRERVLKPVHRHVVIGEAGHRVEGGERSGMFLAIVGGAHHQAEGDCKRQNQLDLNGFVDVEAES